MPFATLLRVHGVRGEARVELDDSSYPSPAIEQQIQLTTPRGAAQIVTVASVRPIHGAYLVSFAEIPQREQLQVLSGSRLAVKSSSLPVPESDNAYVYELVGATAFDAQGGLIGEVTQVVNNGGQALLVMQSSQGQERMLPLVPQTFKAFDRQTMRLDVIVPIGLWDEDEPA